jgi:hypothetical protein
LVKASYFPNWEVSGAKGPYRAAPNSMVVIPTSNEVTLHYGHSGIEYVSYFLSLVGIAGLVYLWRKGRVDYGRPDLGLAGPPGLDDSWTPPAAAEPITFLMDWDEDDQDWVPAEPPPLPPPEAPDPKASLPPPG